MADVLRTAEAYRQFGRSAVLANLGRGLWQRPARGVILTHNGPTDRLTRENVALAASQAGAALGGLTALAHDGFVGFSPPATQLVLPAGARAPSLAGIESHWSEFLDERDVHPSRAPRRTRVARSIIDSASWSANPRYARAIVIAAVQQRLTSTQHIREALSRRGKCRHRALIVESVLDASGGVQSLPERDMRSIIADLGWRVQHQRAVRGRDGRYFLDLYVAELDLSIEVHGIPHLAVQRWDQDLFRANEIVIAGAQLLIFSSYAIRHERAAVVDQLRRFAARQAA
jgi:very-short-patch-repair endonuclease